jgi:hypothetical protein
MSNSKKSFVLRIDPQMLKAVEQWAADEFRSTNGQIEYLLREALKKASRLPKSSASDPTAKEN